MNRVVSVVVLVAVLVNCTYTPKHYAGYERGNAITISSRVGDVIDSQEREHFDLFLGMEGFETAKFYAIRGGGYEVEIVTTGGTFLAVNRDSLAISILRDYINRYEEVIEAREDFETGWQIVGYDDLGQPITRYERDEFGRFVTVACCLGAGLAGGLACFGLGFVMTYSLEPGTSSWPTIIAAFIAIGVALLSGKIGLRYGSKLNEGLALKRIREARKPRLVK
jgi:hypothetical protein